MERIRKRLTVFAGGCMYALFASFGFQAQHEAQSRPLAALLIAAALALPAMALLALLLRTAERETSRKTGGAFSARRAFAGMLICYTPMFLITFPGSFAYDVPFQLEQVFTGSYSTHHPLLHTLLLGGLLKLGQMMGNINAGAALYTVLQMAALAACFAGTCASIARQNGARAAKMSALFFMVYPLHMFFAVNATKDVLFSGLFVLTIALFGEMLRKPDRTLGLCAALSGAGMMLLRNNALYAVVVWILLLPLLLRRRALPAMACAVLAVVLCTGAGNVLRAATGASEGDLCEMLSWPIQQLARARNLHEDRLTQAEKKAIDELMPGESWRLYDPTISDPVKFEFDTQQLLSDPGRYAGVYLSVGRKCVKTYFDALLMHTYSFFYPYSEYGVSGYYLQMGISDQYYDWCDFERVSSQSLFPRVLASLSWRFGAQGAMQIPVVGWLFNMGVIVWIMLYYVLRAAYLGDGSAFAVGLMPVLLWGTFLLGPVMAGRYIYPFVCCLPVLAARPAHNG